VSIVTTGTCTTFESFRSDAIPALVGCQPCRSNAPSAFASAAMTTLPVVLASGRPLSSTIDPRGPIRSTVRKACRLARDEYDGPCRIWIDQARSASRQIAIPTTSASPPTRT